MADIEQPRILDLRVSRRCPRPAVRGAHSARRKGDDSMTVKGLVGRLAVVALGAALASAIYEAVVQVVLRPYANELVEAQLSNSNLAPAATRLYFDFANGVLFACYAALAIFGIVSVVRFYRERRK